MVNMFSFVELMYFIRIINAMKMNEETQIILLIVAVTIDFY